MTQARKNVRKLRDIVSVKDFGAVGDGVTDDSVAIQAAFDYASQLLAVSPVIVGTNMRPNIFLQADRSQYYIATPVTLPTHIRFRGNGCVFSAPAGGRIFNANPAAYRWYMSDMTLLGEDVEGIYADLNNLNNAWFEFERVDLSTQTTSAGKFGIFIASRSARITFRQGGARNCQNAVKTDADFTYFEGGWYSGHVGNNPKPEDTASFEFLGRYANFDNVVFIPEPQGVTRQDKARWIDKRCDWINFSRCHFGAENAGFPIVYEWGGDWAYNQADFSVNFGVSFDSCQIASGSASRTDAGAIVLQDGALPGIYRFTNCSRPSSAPLISAAGYDYSGDDSDRNAALRTALISANAYYRGNLAIHIDHDEYVDKIPYALRGYIRSSDRPRGIALRNPSVSTAIPVLEYAKAGAAPTSTRYYDSYEVIVLLNVGTLLTDSTMQRKTFLVSVRASGTNALVSDVQVLDFEEFPRTVSQAQGDTLITLSEEAGATSTYLRLNLTLADPSVGYESVAVFIRERISAPSFSGSSPLDSRATFSPYPAAL